MHVNWLCSKCTEMLFLFLWGIYLCLMYAWKGWVKATSCCCFMLLFSIMIRHWRWKKHHGCNHLVSWWYTIIIAIRVQLSPFHFNVSDVRQIGLAAELCLFQRLTRAGPHTRLDVSTAILSYVCHHMFAFHIFPNKTQKGMSLKLAKVSIMEHYVHYTSHESNHWCSVYMHSLWDSPELVKYRSCSTEYSHFRVSRLVGVTIT